MFVIKESASEQRSLVIRVFVIHLELNVYMRTNKVRESMKINVFFRLLIIFPNNFKENPILIL